jgi:hypothetical protein
MQATRSKSSVALSSTRRGVYREYLSDWVTFRRAFHIESTLNGPHIRQKLAAGSAPPPQDGNPLSVAVAVALSQTGDDVTLFEINIARGIPVQEGYYVPFKAVGRLVKDDETNKWRLRGEIRPLWQGVVVYMAVMAALLLWVAATVTSAAVSDVGTYAAVYVSLGTTVLLALYMLLLQWRDMRRLAKLLEAIAKP